MNTKQMTLALVGIWLNACLVCAGKLAVDATNSIEMIGGYSMIKQANGFYKFADTSELWRGVWREDTNHWRVELNFENTNSSEVNLDVIIGSAVTNSTSNDGPAYFQTPDGKFARFELTDTNGNIIPPQQSKVFERDFPREISVREYQREPSGGIRGHFSFTANGWPASVGKFKLSDVYLITNEGDYLLTVQPVLYKDKNHLNEYFGIGCARMTVADSNTNFFERTDFPAVAAKIHLKVSP